MAACAAQIKYHPGSVIYIHLAVPVSTVANLVSKCVTQFNSGDEKWIMKEIIEAGPHWLCPRYEYKIACNNVSISTTADCSPPKMIEQRNVATAATTASKTARATAAGNGGGGIRKKDLDQEAVRQEWIPKLASRGIDLAAKQDPNSQQTSIRACAQLFIDTFKLTQPGSVATAQTVERELNTLPWKFNVIAVSYGMSMWDRENARAFLRGLYSAIHPNSNSAPIVMVVATQCPRS